MSPSLLLGNVPWECLCVYLVIFCIGCWGFVFLLAEMNVMPSSVPKVIDWHIRCQMPEKICTYIVGLFLGIRCRKLRFLDLVCYRQGLDRTLRVIRHSVVRDNKHPWCPVHTEGICFMSPRHYRGDLCYSSFTPLKLQLSLIHWSALDFCVVKTHPTLANLFSSNSPFFNTTKRFIFPVFSNTHLT